MAEDGAGGGNYNRGMRRPVAIAGLLLTVFAAPVLAQAPKCQLVRVAEWEVKFRGGLPTVEGAINGKKIGVLLDTGAYASLITKDAANRLGVEMRGARYETIVGVGGESDVHVARIDELYIAGATRTNLRVRVSGERPIPGVDFILGDDFFNHVDLEFDYAKGVVRLFQPRNCKGEPLAYWDASAQQVPMEEGEKIVIPLKVNGRSARALLDSGASVSGISLGFAARVGVTPESPGAAPSVCSTGLGAYAVQSWVAPFDSIAVGDEVIHNARLRMADYGPELARIHDMLLGTDFLRTHRVLVARSQRKVYFTYIGGQVFPATPALGCDERVSGKNATQAMAVYDDAIAANPNDDDARIGRAALRMRANNSKAALEDLDAVLRSRPNHAVALSMRMEARSREKDYAGALADSDAAIANGMRTSYIYVQRAAMWGVQGQDARALPELDEALKLDPRNVSALRGRGHLHFGAGRYPEAERDFTDAASVTANARAYDAIWAALSRMRRGADAGSALQQGAAKTKPDQWPTPVIMYLQDRIDRDALMTAAARGEKDRKGQECEARFYSAQRLLAQKETGEARTLLEKARDDCPRNDLEYHEAIRELAKLPP